MIGLVFRDDDIVDGLIPGVLLILLRRVRGQACHVVAEIQIRRRYRRVHIHVDIPAALLRDQVAHGAALAEPFADIKLGDERVGLFLAFQVEIIGQARIAVGLFIARLGAERGVFSGVAHGVGADRDVFDRSAAVDAPVARVVEIILFAVHEDRRGGGIAVVFRPVKLDRLGGNGIVVLVQHQAGDRFGLFIGARNTDIRRRDVFLLRFRKRHAFLILLLVPGVRLAAGEIDAEHFIRAAACRRQHGVLVDGFVDRFQILFVLLFVDRLLLPQKIFSVLFSGIGAYTDA